MLGNISTRLEYKQRTDDVNFEGRRHLTNDYTSEVWILEQLAGLHAMNTAEIIAKCSGEQLEKLKRLTKCVN